MSDSDGDEDILEIGSGLNPDDRATVTVDIRTDLEYIDVGGVDIGTDQLPFDDRSFSRVIADNVLEHIPPGQIGHVFEEVDRVLQPKGVFEVIIPHAGTWAARTDPTHYGTGGWTPDIEKYFTGELQEYWPGINWDVSTAAKLEVPTFLRTSLRLSVRINHGGLSTELAKLPFVTGTVEFVAEKN